MRRSAALVSVVVAVALGCVGCTQAAPSSRPRATLSVLPDDPSRPYVISVIENHFHDAHPTLPIGPGRELVFRHQGEALHEVSILGPTSIIFSRDIRPGQQVRIPDASSFLGGPGDYVFYCKYHLAQGMAGIIVISD